jgi:hypothetical protein
MLIYMSVDRALYAFSLLLTIIKEMRYAYLNAQLMSIIPYAFTCLLVCVFAINAYTRLSWLDGWQININNKGTSTLACLVLEFLDFSSWQYLTVLACPTLLSS